MILTLLLLACHIWVKMGEEYDLGEIVHRANCGVQWFVLGLQLKQATQTIKILEINP